MDAHVSAILQWAGPALLTIFGVVICAGLRAAFHSFERILKRNEKEHMSFANMLKDVERRLSEAKIRIEADEKQQMGLIDIERRQDGLLQEHGERLCLVETKVEYAQKDIEKIKKIKAD